MYNRRGLKVALLQTGKDIATGAAPDASSQWIDRTYTIATRATLPVQRLWSGRIVIIETRAKHRAINLQKG